MMFGFRKKKTNERQANFGHLIAEGALIIDVRSPSEYAIDGFDGAINVPLNQMEGSSKKLKETSRKIVAYCQSGMRSGMAVRQLRSLGVDAYNGGGLKEMRGILQSRDNQLG